MSKRYNPSKAFIDVETFKRIVFQVCTIEKASLLVKARKPSYEMETNFGVCGLKKSCGQLVRNHKVEELVNKQVLAVTNFNPVRIAGVKSEYLTLGFFDDLDDGQAIVITPVDKVENGLKFTLSGEKVFPALDNQEIIEYHVFESLEVKSATVIDVITSNENGCSYCVVYFGDDIYDLARIPGHLNGNKSKYLNIQVLVVTNVKLNDTTELGDVNFFVIALPIDDKKNITLMKIDKKVRNNLNLK